MIITALDLLHALKQHAQTYLPDAAASVARNAHMNDLREPLSQEAAEAVVVDFINHVGYRVGVDFALYTSDLRAPEAPEDH